MSLLLLNWNILEYNSILLLALHWLITESSIQKPLMGLYVVDNAAGSLMLASRSV